MRASLSDFISFMPTLYTQEMNVPSTVSSKEELGDPGGSTSRTVQYDGIQSRGQWMRFEIKSQNK